MLMILFKCSYSLLPFKPPLLSLLGDSSEGTAGLVCVVGISRPRAEQFLLPARQSVTSEEPTRLFILKISVLNSPSVTEMY